MSFSSELKEDLSKVNTRSSECCKLAELAGCMITNCSVVRIGNKFVLKMATESSSSIRRMYNAFKTLYEIIPVTNIEKEKLGQETVLYELIIEKDEDLKKVFSSDTFFNIDVNLRIVMDDKGQIRDKECCKRAFLRGVFLGSGSIMEPTSGNHLEIVLSSLENANYINSILAEFGIMAKMMKRKKSLVLYIKDAETISDFLRIVGSNKAILSFEQAKVEKEFRNNMNRKINCEVANIDKTVMAASEQLKDIMKLKEKGKFGKLSPNLKQIANLRIKYPEASLDKIGSMLNPPLSRSGVSHRFKKIKELANEVE
ncbi:MAG: DNA-binding protein WhiA [Clostridia bacterium]|nr:DNA-binding protein WhiA [Clostridia bacterium]